MTQCAFHGIGDRLFARLFVALDVVGSHHANAFAWERERAANNIQFDISRVILALARLLMALREHTVPPLAEAENAVSGINRVLAGDILEHATARAFTLFDQARRQRLLQQALLLF